MNSPRHELAQLCLDLEGAVDHYKKLYPHVVDPAVTSDTAGIRTLRRIVCSANPDYGAARKAFALVEHDLDWAYYRDADATRLAQAVEDDAARHVRELVAETGCILEAELDPPPAAIQAAEPARASRRTRCITGVAVRLQPPETRARYREEFAAELADLPRCDQTPYAIRLVRRSWALRHSLTGKSSVRSTRVVIVAGFGACSAAALATLGWPAAFLGSVMVIAAMWTVSSPDRTRHLASLIRAFRSGPPPARKK